MGLWAWFFWDGFSVPHVFPGGVTVERVGLACTVERVGLACTVERRI
jgi:hypothetical protein